MKDFQAFLSLAIFLLPFVSLGHFLLPHAMLSLVGLWKALSSTL